MSQLTRQRATSACASMQGFSRARTFALKPLALAAVFMCMATVQAQEKDIEYSDTRINPALTMIGTSVNSLGPSSSANFTGNKVKVDFTTGGNTPNIGGVVWAAHADTTDAVSGNEIEIVKGVIVNSVQGAYNKGTGTVSNNHVTIGGGTVGTFIWGGHAGAGDAVENTVTVNGGIINSRGASSSSGVSGGYSTSGVANSNQVIINDGKVHGAVYGGQSITGAAHGNQVTINGGTMLGAIYGGHGVTGASDNTVRDHVQNSF